MKKYPSYYSSWERAEGALAVLENKLTDEPCDEPCDDNVRARFMRRQSVREAVASAARDGLLTGRTELYLMVQDPRGAAQTAATRAAYDVHRAVETALRHEASTIRDAALNLDVWAHLDAAANLDAKINLDTKINLDAAANLPDDAFIEGIARRAVLTSAGRDDPFGQGFRPLGQGFRVDLEAWREGWEENKNLPGLIRAALGFRDFHDRDPFGFETPRIGRLIVPLVLSASGKTSAPLVLLSSVLTPRYLEVMYADQDVWIEMFLGAVDQWCRQAIKDITHMKRQRALFLERANPKRSTSRMPEAIDFILDSPVFTAKALSTSLSITQAAADRMIERLVRLGLLNEITGRSQYRIYAAHRLLVG